MAAEFFDEMYARAGRDDRGVPWQHALSRRLIGEWHAGFDADAHERALVVAAGLGDDAAALADRGLDVVAFDAAPTAVEWARERHPDAAVDWRVADLFDPPAEWQGAFDLVVEVFTVQSIEPARQEAAAETVRGFVGPGGTLVVVALVHDGRAEPQGPPWPLHPSTFGRLVGDGRHVQRRSESLDGGVVAELVELIVRPDPTP